MEKSNNKQQDVILSEQDVWSVIEYARSLSGGMYGTSYLNPELVNARMRDVTLNPMAATQEQLDAAMAEPKTHEKELRAFSQDFELKSMVYKRLVSYLANILSFDITYTSNAKPEDYNTPKYRKDLEIVESFLDKFNYEKEFRITLKEMVRNDAFFGCFRDVGDRYVLQELPAEYCKITGKWARGFMFSFNMYWFLQPGVYIDEYPSFFKKKYKELWLEPNIQKGYNPALAPELRGNSTWIYWVDVPVDVGVCFKLSPELATNLPYFSPLFNDLILQALMRNLQKNVNMAAASRMIVGEVPMLNKDTKATVKDSIAVSPDLLGKFMALVKSAISESIKVASAPLTNMQGISFDANNDMYDSYLKTALASSGINTNLLFTSDVKQNAIETQLSLNVDEQMVTSLYCQFEDCLNYHLSKLTRRFIFEVSFEGTAFYLDRQNRLEVAMNLFDKGIVMPQKIAAAIGMKPSKMRKQMEESAAFGFMKLLTPPTFEQQKEILELTGKQQEELAKTNAKLAPKTTPIAKPVSKPAGEKATGRPRKPDSKTSEEGLNTRAGAENIGRGGKKI